MDLLARPTIEGMTAPFDHATRELIEDDASGTLDQAYGATGLVDSGPGWRSPRVCPVGADPE
jgi:hypothetical protein